MLKFRTMVEGAAEQQEELEERNEARRRAVQDPRGSARHPRRARSCASLSLDELPQLLNVLRGEMSLVGPRPLPLRDYEQLEAWHRKRYLVLPGITGLWQISGRSNLDFDDLVRLDFYYIENWSIWLDISILVKTIPAVLAGRGAYYDAASPLRESARLGVEVELAAVAALGRHEVGGRGTRDARVVGELLAHHARRRALRESEAPSQRDAALERVAVRHALVADPAQVPRLVRQHCDRAGRLGERALVALVGQAMQAIADGRRQERLRPADFGDTLGVLDDADGLAPRVAADVRAVAGDLGRLLGEQPLGAQLLGRLEPAPAAIGEQHEEDHRRRPDDRGSLEQRRQAARAAVAAAAAAARRPALRGATARGPPRSARPAPRRSSPWPAATRRVPRSARARVRATRPRRSPTGRRPEVPGRGATGRTALPAGRPRGN